MQKLVDSRQIKSTSFYVEKALIARLYVWPFALMYASWAAIWFYLTRVNPSVLKNFIEYSLSTALKYPFLSLGFWIQYEEFMLIPVGFLLLFHFITLMSCSWNVFAKALITCTKVKSLAEAEKILVVPVEHRGKSEFCKIIRGEEDSCLFIYQQRKFYWNSERKMFQKPAYPENLNFSHYSDCSGLTAETHEESVERFGRNEFDIPVPTFLSLFKEHIKAPFFVFQIFCVGLWCLDEYWYYSLFTLFMLFVFESTVVQQRLKTLQEFRGMSVPPVDMFVRRDGKWLSVKSNEIVPGDLCALPFSENLDADGLTVPCDLILLTGSCIVNEAMISGESTPLLKESIEDAASDDLIDMTDTDRNHVLFGGTKILQIHTTTIQSQSSKAFPIAPPGEVSCPVIIGYAARTGFGTLQGKLVRTMIYSSEHVSANNFEAFLFIGFLLIFALIAAGYVLVKGVEDEGRSRYKLLLECTLIITSVVPPELPMELSMAVNNSLQELSKYAIFCMEPFRIPLAGKIDICCFDKTGTLTAENLIVEGVAGLDESDRSKVLTDIKQLNQTVKSVMGTRAQKVMSACHSLFLVREGQIAGDPMEKATLEFMDWNLSASDVVSSRSKSSAVTSYQICHRFPFSSALKRMSVIVKDNSNSNLFVAVKGAPEVLQGMFVDAPEWYETVFTSLAQSGARVIALGYKDYKLPSTSATFKHAQRNDIEKALHFCGFLVFRCPLKKDSKSALKLLRNSSHQIIMITGDNALTAIHTAKELDMIPKDNQVLLFETDDEEKLKVICADSGKAVDWLDSLKVSSSDALKEMKKRNISLCFTGNGYDVLARDNPELSLCLLPQTSIFARTSPIQKETILARLKSPPLSFHTLMCGDGTNDVGALKQAHIGVALLDGRPEDLPKILKEMKDSQIRKHQKTLIENRRKWEANFNTSGNGTAANTNLDKMLQAIEQADAEGNNLVKLGDASVAAPFTSKISTIQSVCTLIRMGRCTLVTTIQMYKILALNSLVYAYNLSVLNLSGIRYGDFQMTITGMLLSSCFLFLTRGNPIKEMSSARPQSNIFNVYLITSVLLQFLLHVVALIYVTESAKRYEIPWLVTEKLKFKPGLMNTAVYLLGLLLQVSTFVVNYQGRPFRESLFENKSLRNSLLAVSAIGMVAALELYPEFNEWLELVPMPPKFKIQLVSAILIDFSGCFAIEFLSKRLFFSNTPKFEKIL